MRVCVCVVWYDAAEYFTVYPKCSSEINDGTLVGGGAGSYVVYYVGIFCSPRGRVDRTNIRTSRSLSRSALTYIRLVDVCTPPLPESFIVLT